MYWHGINDYSNRPNRRVAEAAQIGRELAQAGPAIAGSTYQASVAIVKDYDNEWDGELDSWHGPMSAPAPPPGSRRCSTAIFLLNYAGTPQSIRLHQPATDLLTGQHHEGDISVGGYGVLLLRFG
jgi:beta-galactosidase GanA